ncbi:hypothetical protein ACDY97_26920 [Rhizobium mongolense]|uniref:hypothetical protein n=1 Tax=Rhizobium mongolense TaxID=57676 RepID=UPI003558CDDA
MISSEKGLAELLDDWVREERALITERREEIVLGQLSHKDALAIVAGFEAIGWNYTIEDGTPSEVTKSQVVTDYAPYRVTASKPAVSPDRDFVLTNAGLRDWLGRRPTHSVVEVVRLDVGFETLSVKFTARGHPSSFTPEPLPSDPRTVVRETGAVRVVPGDLSSWILRNDAVIDISDPATAVWADEAVAKLAVSLCSEVEGQDTLVFKGPPVIRYRTTAGMASKLGADGFTALQQCARWVFYLPKEMETRHILLTAELSRSAPGSDEAVALFRNSGLAALEGAKIAFELGLNKISSDSLKALADLRKAVSDEAAKLGDSTRQLASAVTGALFGGIGLVVARLTMTGSSTAVAAAVLLIGIVLTLYVGVTIASGTQFVTIQRELRDQWRNRLYRFLPESEYQKMVVDPAEKAEGAFRLASWISGILATVLLIAVTCVSAPELWKGYAIWRASAAPTAPANAGPPPAAGSAPLDDKSTSPPPASRLEGQPSNSANSDEVAPKP